MLYPETRECDRSPAKLRVFTEPTSGFRGAARLLPESQRILRLDLRFILIGGRVFQLRRLSGVALQDLYRGC